MSKKQMRPSELPVQRVLEEGVEAREVMFFCWPWMMRRGLEESSLR